MSQKSISQYVSQIRGFLKLNNADNRLDDRHIYLEMFDVRGLLLKQSNQWLMGSTDVFQIIPQLELIDVDVVEACGIDTDCKIKRSRYKLPAILEDTRGPIIKLVSSLDGYRDLSPTTPLGYLRKIKKTTSKYDKNIYFWVRNDYLYIPNVDWDAILIEAYLTTDYIDPCCDDPEPCKNFQDNLFRVPERLAAPMLQIVRQNLATYLQLQTDTRADKNENNK